MSKATKGIIALICALFVFGIFSSEGRILLIAAIGGLFVFLGLWIESEADEEEKKEHLSNFTDAARRLKFKSKVGWRILMIGISLEIAIAGFEAIKSEVEFRLIREQAAKNNPLNQSITSLTADVSFSVHGKVEEKKFVGIDLDGDLSKEAPLGGILDLALEDDKGVNKVRLIAIKRIKSQGDTDPGYFIKFDRGPIASSFPSKASLQLNGRPMVVEDLKFLRRIVITAAFLPDNSEISGGVATVRANNNEKSYIIPPQKTQTPFGFIVGIVETNNVK